MRLFRVYFIKDGTKFTKLVYADNLHDVYLMFEGLHILMVKEIDTTPDIDIEVICLN